MFGTKKNAYGKCVSQTAKKDAAEDAEQAKQASAEAVEECRAVKTPGSKNAFGKCVSEKAKAKKAAADKEDEAQEDDKINAAKTCKAAKKADAEQFGNDCGTARTPSASASPRPPRSSPPSARPSARPRRPRSTATAPRRLGLAVAALRFRSPRQSSRSR